MNGQKMEYTTSAKLSKLWGISPRQISKLCAAGRIEGAIKIGKTWNIPIEAKRPIDGRMTTKEYCDWRIRYGRKMGH